MSVTSALIGKALGGHGSKPDVPELPPINPSILQQQTIQDNLKALPETRRLASGVTDLTTEQLARGLDLALPGQRQTATRTVGQQLRGEIPTDVSRAVQASAAETAFAGGFEGSGVSRGLTLRDLGLTSLDIQQQGLQNFQALASMTTGPGLDPTSMFFSPQQRLNFAVQDRSQMFQRDLTAAQVDAAPDPFKMALLKGVNEDEEGFRRFLGSVFGFGSKMAGAKSSGGG